MKKMDEHSPPPPANLSSELHGAFRDLCERLRASGAEVTELDALVIARIVEAEHGLERAKTEAATAPLVIESKANGLTINPVHKMVASAEANLRAWLRLLPKPSGNGHPVHTPPPHVSTAGDVAPTTGPEAVANGEPPERVQKLRELLKEFRARQGADAAAEAGAEAVPFV